MRKILRILRYDWPLHLVLLITSVLPDNVIFIRLRGFLARPFFKSCGGSLGLGRRVTFYNPGEIEIGHHVYIGYGAWFSGGFGIRIGDEVLIGPYVVISTSNHTMSNGSYRFGTPDGESVLISKGSWIGAHVTILKGVTIGEGSVVAANSVVSSSVGSFTVVGGVPAREIKRSI